MLYACIIVKNGQTDVLGHSMSVFQILKKIGSQPPVFIAIYSTLAHTDETQFRN